MRKRLLSLFIVLTMIASLIIVPATIISAAPSDVLQNVRFAKGDNPGEVKVLATLNGATQPKFAVFSHSALEAQLREDEEDDTMEVDFGVNVVTSYNFSTTPPSNPNGTGYEAVLMINNITGANANFEHTLTIPNNTWNGKGDKYYVLYGSEGGQVFGEGEIGAGYFATFELDATGNLVKEKTKLTVN